MGLVPAIWPVRWPAKLRDEVSLNLRRPDPLPGNPTGMKDANHMNVAPNSDANSLGNHSMQSPGRAAYFECFSGASGDMILGALVDAGWPVAELEAHSTLLTWTVGPWR